MLFDYTDINNPKAQKIKNFLSNDLSEDEELEGFYTYATNKNEEVTDVIGKAIDELWFTIFKNFFGTVDQAKGKIFASLFQPMGDVEGNFYSLHAEGKITEVTFILLKKNGEHDIIISPSFNYDKYRMLVD